MMRLKMLLVCLIIPFCAMAQHTVSGVVLDQYGIPVNGAKVSGLDVYSTETGFDGRFVLESLIPLKKVKVNAPGMLQKQKRARDGMVIKMKPQTFWNARPEKWSPFILAEMEVPQYNEMPVGLMVGIVKKWGVYMRGVYSFNAPKTSGEDVTRDVEDNYWKPTHSLSGNYQQSYNSLSVGFIYRPVLPLSIYVGAGVAQAECALESSDKNQYYKYDWYSFTYKDEIIGEIGLMFAKKNLIVNIGVDYNEQRHEPGLNAHLGIGYIFN